VRNENGPAPLAQGDAGPEKIAAAKPVASAVQSSGRQAESAPLTLAALSAALRDYGIAQANESGDQYWRSCFDAGVEHLAASGRVFSTDDLFTLGVPAPDHPNRVGAAISAAMKAETIRPVGYRQSARPSRHAGVVRVWVGSDAR
jgi:hypothetical protein